MPPTWTTDPTDFPLDLRVGGEHVRVDAPGLVLNSNPWIDGNANGWTARSATATYSEAKRFHPKWGSLLITPAGDGSAPELSAQQGVAATALQTYLAMMRVFSPNGWAGGTRMKVEWYSALVGGSFVSATLTPPVVVPAAKWTLVAGVLTAPAGAGAALLLGTQAGAVSTPANTWYATGICLIPESTYNTEPQNFTMGPGGRGVNGVQRAWPTGTPVDVWYPAVAAM